MSRSRITDFEILNRLGSGSFGTVYKVRRLVDGALYVIKNVRIVELSRKEQSEAINEVQILSQLKSPFVVRYYDSFIEADSLHICMEFCNRYD
jgi:NIMA (never in mitosis gene a)-related kinase 1/4/5